MNSTNSVEIARVYLQRGWAPIPIPHGEKNPGVSGWPALRLKADELSLWFQGSKNVGVLLGEPSNWLVDVDLDHVLAVSMADTYLPPTGSIFGRVGKLRSHRLYYVRSPIETLKRPRRIDARQTEMIVELRSTGLQTVFPGSVHPSGELIERNLDGAPALVEPRELVAAVNTLADDVLAQLGETLPPGIRAHTGHEDTRRGFGGEPVHRLLARLKGVKPSGSGWQACCPAHDDRAPSLSVGVGDGGKVLVKCHAGCDTAAVVKAMGMSLRDLMPASDMATDGNRLQIDARCQDLPTVSAQSWLALEAANDPPRLFRYGGRPARIERGDEGAPVIHHLDEDRMRYELARAADWVKVTYDEGGKKVKPAKPPKDVVADLLAAPDMPLPVLVRVVETPVYAPDGTLATCAGYHTASRTLFSPSDGFQVPQVPDRPDDHLVIAARRAITEELLVDFPFVGDAERAHAVTFLLLPFARDLISGATPLHLFEKPSPGTGATLLVDVLASLAAGRPIKTMTEAGSEEEWRKRITAKLASGAQFVLIDNLATALDSASLSSAITAPWWEDRLLGLSEMISVPVRCIWLATGNNPQVSPELGRRIVRIRLDAGRDQPWLRPETGFRHPRLREWVTAHRSELVWSALVLIRAWLAQDRPPGRRTLGMFEDWARVMGGILDVAGIPGFLGNLQDFYVEGDQETAGLRAFIGAWWERHGEQDVGVGEIWPLVIDMPLPLGDGNERSQRTRLGKLLGSLRDRVFGITCQYGHLNVVVARGQVQHNAARWCLRRRQGEVGNVGGVVGPLTI